MTSAAGFLDTMTLTEHGISASFLHSLSQRGYKTIGDVARIDHTLALKVAHALGIPKETMGEIVQTAQIASGFVIKRRDMRLLQGDPLWFDIETGVPWNKGIWLIGIFDNNLNKVFQFYADSWDGEREMLQEFDEFLRDRPRQPLFHYSCNNFDVRMVKQSCMKYGLQHHIFIHPEQDLCGPIRNSFYIPTPNRKLKTLARYLGFDLSLEDYSGYMDGYECALHYEEHVAYGTPLNKAVFEYNANDVIMLKHVIEELENRSVKNGIG